MLIFLDIETTGLENEDTVCSIAVVYEQENELISKYELVNEGRKIPPKASSIHHITNEMIENELALLDSDIWNFLVENNKPETVIVGHNINFDIKKLENSGFMFQGALVDTLRVSKHLLPDCEAYSLQILRYELKLYRFEEEGTLAHHALSDAKLTKLLYEYLLSMASQKEIMELSYKNVLLEKFSFGKYKGKYIEEIALYDKAYLQWMINNLNDLDEDIRYSVNYYL